MLENVNFEAVNDIIQAENTTKLFELFEKVGFSLEILNCLAVEGLKANGIRLDNRPETKNTNHDPLMAPKDVAEYLKCSTKHLREKLMDEYQIKSTGSGTGRRFALSEINRVKQEMLDGKSVQDRETLDD